MANVQASPMTAVEQQFSRGNGKGLKSGWAKLIRGLLQISSPHI
jgi:hypothetical protein